MGKYTAKLIILWYDHFGENHTPLHRNGMATIPKTFQSFKRITAFTVAANETDLRRK